jgi:hypothetical protein
MGGLLTVISLPWVVGALTLFIVKHLVADFLLQPGWMSQGKSRSHGWVMPAAAHALVHATATGVIFGLLAPAYIWLAGVDFFVHFAIDRSKVLVNRTFAWNISKPGFWLSFGFDQTLHELTNVAFALVIAAAHTSV